MKKGILSPEKLKKVFSDNYMLEAIMGGYKDVKVYRCQYRNVNESFTEAEEQTIRRLEQEINKSCEIRMFENFVKEKDIQIDIMGTELSPNGILFIAPILKKYTKHDINLHLKYSYLDLVPIFRRPKKSIFPNFTLHDQKLDCEIIQFSQKKEPHFIDLPESFKELPKVKCQGMKSIPARLYYSQRQKESQAIIDDLTNQIKLLNEFVRLSQMMYDDLLN